MVNQEIVEGLRTALSRGYSLESAMMSFFNAGYKKQEIEEAARALYTHPSHPLSHPGKAIPEHIKKPLTPEVKPVSEEKIKKPIKPLKPKEPEKPGILKKTEEPEKVSKSEISKYEEKTKPKGKLITIFLIILLILLISGLIAIFIFKEQLADFFSKLFA